jgi:hypothetical protein
MNLLLADLVVLLHLAFVAFVVAGGLLALRWPRLAWLHLPASAWGAAVEFFGWTCPLTPLEDALRGGGDRGDFVARYLLPVLYPAGLTADIQVPLGIGVVAINAAIYAWVLHRRRR